MQDERQENLKRITGPKGFTFLELLVSLAIVGTVFSLGLAKYNEFNRRQIVNQAAQELKSNLRLAQGKALSGEKNCTGSFLGYRVVFFGDRYCLRSACEDNEASCKWYDFPAKVTAWAAPGFGGFLFKALAKGVEGAGEVYLSGYEVYQKIVVETTVEATGNIYIEEVAGLPGGVVPLDPFGPTPTPGPVSTPTPTSPPIPTSMPTPTPTPTPTPVELIISNIVAESGRPYVDAKLGVGDQYYTDRNYTIESIPAGFGGLTWIKTANADKSAVSETFLSFDVNVDVRVYIAYDNRGVPPPSEASPPNWLTSSFTYEGQGIGVNEFSPAASPLLLYGRQYSGGSTVILGGNRGAGSNGAESNYVVLVRQL